MATETTVRVTCDRCKDVHFEGLSKDKPQHYHITFWREGPGWEPDDLCKECAEHLKDMLRRFVEDVVQEVR